MPELPEVETTVRGLQKEILGLNILDVWTDLATKDKRKIDTVANPKFFLFFKKEINKQKISSIERRGKNILINLTSPTTILIHLKMTGHLFYGKNHKNKYAHAIFTLSNKHFLVFSDVRKFGKITLIQTKDLLISKHLKDLGPEPLDKKFTITNFKLKINKKPNQKIKTVLLDQSIIVGIGNIYSDEILWQAGIHPERKVAYIKEFEFKKMFEAMKKILKKSIKLGGDSNSDYLNIYGLPGKFQNFHRAYQQTGKKCSKIGCSGVIMRKVVNGRSSHFCSVHQI